MTVPGTVRLTRADLYTQVWSTPMNALAKEYNLSDVGLAKICKKHNVPRPPRGYWVKLEFGQKVSPTTLPECTDKSLEQIEIRVEMPFSHTSIPSSKPAEEPVYDSDIQTVLMAAKALPKIQLAASLKSPHHLVAIAKSGFEQALVERRSDHEPLVYPKERENDEPAPCICVGKNSIQRALYIFDAFIKAFESIDGVVQVQFERSYYYANRQQTMTKICGDDVSAIRLRELYKRIKRVKESPWGRDYDEIPSGVFVLDAGARNSSKVFCRDTPGKPIEEKLNELIIRLVEQAGEQRIKKRAEDERRRIEEEKERRTKARETILRRRRADLKRRQLEEQERVSGLFRDAMRWHKSQIVTRYIAACVNEVSRSGTSKREQAQWLSWAKEQVARLNPLIPSPHSVLDDHISTDVTEEEIEVVLTEKDLDENDE